LGFALTWAVKPMVHFIMRKVFWVAGLRGRLAIETVYAKSCSEKKLLLTQYGGTGCFKDFVSGTTLILGDSLPLKFSSFPEPS